MKDTFICRPLKSDSSSACAVTTESLSANSTYAKLKPSFIQNNYQVKFDKRGIRGCYTIFPFFFFFLLFSFFFFTFFHFFFFFFTFFSSFFYGKACERKEGSTSSSCNYLNQTNPFGWPLYLSQRIVTLLIDPQPWKCASNSSAVAP